TVTSSATPAATITVVENVKYASGDPCHGDRCRDEDTMNIAIRYVIPALTLLAAASPVAARAAAAPQVLEKTRDAVVKGVTIAADKTKEGVSKTGEVMTDEWITTRIHQRFVDEAL